MSGSVGIFRSQKLVRDLKSMRNTDLYRMGSKTLTDSHIPLLNVYNRIRLQWPCELRRRSTAA